MTTYAHTVASEVAEALERALKKGQEHVKTMGVYTAYGILAQQVREAIAKLRDLERRT